MSVMYGPDAKTITRRIKMESEVGRDDMIATGRKWERAPRIFLVPVPMPNSIEQYVWFDLTYPLRAIYLPRQHQVDDGASKEWCIFQHLSFRLRTLKFNAYMLSGEKEITAEEREKFTITMDGSKYSSGDQYLFKAIEMLSNTEANDSKSSAVGGNSPKGEAATSAKSVSELKDLQGKADPSLRRELEKKLAELCKTALFTRNTANKKWAKDYGKLRESLKSMAENQEAEAEKTKKDLPHPAKMGLNKTAEVKYVNIETLIKEKKAFLEAIIKHLEALPHENPLKPEDEKPLQEKNTFYNETMDKSRQIYFEMANAKSSRLKMNTYTREAVTLEQNKQLGWGIRKDWIVRFDVAMIYNTTMVPRGWLLPEYQSPYCGVDIFNQKSINVTFPQNSDFEVITMNRGRSTDIKDMINKEWGVQLKYDDKPVEPDFIWGVVNSIAQIGLGLVPGWGPFLVYGDTIIYNLIFTDKFTKVVSGDRDSVTELTLSSTAVLVGSGATLKGLIKPKQASSVLALRSYGVR